MRQTKRLWLFLSCLYLFALGCGLSNLGNRSSNATPPPPTSQIILAPLRPSPPPLSPEIMAQLTADELLLVNLYDRVQPSVVSIAVMINVDSQNPQSEDLPNPFNPLGQGTGFVYSQEGYIVTNHHVIEEASHISVTFYERTQLPAMVVGTDIDTNLAVIQISAPPESLQPVRWANSDEVRVGQRAIASGNST